MEVRLLGVLEVLDDTGGGVPVSGAKLRALLAALALRPRQVVSAEVLVEELWGEDARANAANSLQGLVSKLRKVLAADAVVTNAPGYLLDIGVEDTDVGRFEALVTNGRKAMAAGDSGAAADTFRQALALWRGPALSEFVYEDFAQGAIARLEEERAAVLEERAEADLACGRHAELVGELEEAVTRTPLRERLQGQLMLALYRCGRQADALRQFQHARRVLGEELGLEPGPELRRLEAAMLAQDPALDAPPAVVEEEVTGNLPAALSPFIGRRAELAHVAELIGECRLVTLTGPGGAGKTRLALEAATLAARGFAHGAWVVELANVTDTAGVGPAIASALDVHASPGQRRDAAASSLEALTAHLARRELLILLDNCEHVIGEAAAVTEDLLRRVPGLRVLATSREPLDLPGETIVAVGPMALNDAVVLFSQRAAAAAPGFASIGGAGEEIEAVCRRLDAMPLALELAAARLRALPLQELAARLDDRFQILAGGHRTAPARHQTLRAVVDWSYDSLFGDEQRLFMRLAVFVGPFGLEAVAAVCADEALTPGDQLELLLRLVDKSLVIAHPAAGGAARFSLLQTLREYGCERLADAGDADAVRARHAAYYRTVAEEAHDGLRGAGGQACRAHLNEVLGDLRAALDWHIVHAEAQGALALAGGIARLWFLNGDLHQGARWLQDALDAAGSASIEAQAMAHAWHGYFTCMSVTPTAGLLECEAATAAMRSSTNATLRAEALLIFAMVLSHARQFERSLEAAAEAGRLIEPGRDEWLLGAHDVLVATSLAKLGRLDEAEASARSSLNHLDNIGEVQFSIDALRIMADIAEIGDDLDRASALYEQILDRCLGTDLGFYESMGLVRLAKIRTRQGNDRAADELYSRALPFFRSVPWLAAEATVGHAAVARRLGDMARARALLETAEAEFDALGFDAGHVQVLAGLTWWALAAGDLELAGTVASAAVVGAAGDPNLQLMAETAAAAAAVTETPTPENKAAFLTLATRQAGAGAARSSLTDEADVADLVRRLTTDA